MTDDTPNDPQPIRGPRPFRPAGSVRPSPVSRSAPPPWDPTRQRRLVAIAIALVVLIVVVAPLASARFTDWLWYREIGYERVFLTKIVAQWTLGIIAGIGAFLILYLNARFALRAVELRPVAVIDRTRSGPQSQAALLVRLAQVLALPVVLLFTAIVALLATTEWRTLAQFLYRSPFGFVDPVFGRDVSYYVFTLPVIDATLNYAGAIVLIALGVVAIPIYAMRGDIAYREPSNLRIQKNAQVHLAVLAALLLVVTGFRTLLVDVPSLLQAPHGPLQGASYTDLHVRLPMLRLLGGLAFVSAIPVLWGAWRGRVIRDAGLAIVGYIVVTLLLTGLVPTLFQRLAVQPNELAREAPQIRRHIDATRTAWGLDSVERRELGTQRRLTLRDIEANQATIANVRLWDRDLLLQTFGQIQAIRTYYDFVSVDDDRYQIGGSLRQVLLSAREMNVAALPTRTFVNEHLTFTHGMGLTLGPSNQVTAEGLPLLYIKDLPPASSVSIQVTRPQIYFGELSDQFVLAPSQQREFDYPAGEGDAAIYSTYAGRAGVSVGSFSRRLLFAMRFRSLNILLSRGLTPETKVLFHRNIVERARLALPFVRFDSDPYLVITDDGRLQWILDAYTTTSRFPYAQSLPDGTNYMRNSVKVIVDAYDGDVRAYLADPGDPMIRTLSRIYPGLLRPLAEMPADLRRHLRYPGDLFRAQTAMYATFHMTDPETFYHREDQWQVPASQRRADAEGFMRHTVMRLPGEEAPEFILMRPFTPRQKDNLAAWMVARNDGENYGRLVAYRFPRQSLIFGPAQIANRISQDTEVSRQISLWSQGGSSVIRGEILVIPIEESLIYVQPLYLQSQGGRIPELKRVIVAHENQVAMEETLEAGLRRLFAGGPSSLGTPTGTPAAAPREPTTTSSATTAELLRQANQHYERARAAQRADDWATYGAEMQKLGEILRQLNTARPPG